MNVTETKVTLTNCARAWGGGTSRATATSAVAPTRTLETSDPTSMTNNSYCLSIPKLIET